MDRWLGRTLGGGRDRLYFRARGSGGPGVENHCGRFGAHVRESVGDACWKHVASVFSFGGGSPDPDCPRRGGRAKKFWSFVRSLEKDASGINTPRENGVLKTGALGGASVCGGRFRSAFTRGSGGGVPSEGAGPFAAVGEVAVDPNGVVGLLNGLGVHGAPGPGGLGAGVLKGCSSGIAPVLTYIFSESLAQGAVPDDWRRANVAPVFERGEKCGAANYRPVSLACICCKTLEHIIVSNIGRHLALGNILADCQHGFRGQGSCEAQLVQFYHDLVGDLDRAVGRGRRRTGVVVVDFAGAFGRVPRERLLYKLGFCGIGGSARKWVDSWLSGRSRRVVLDGRASGPVP
ncbi:MAG: reverse transcriptase domain-containing protein, partial [Candidatus Thiodiazotropha sp.]